jgi:hypothetical protein
MRATALLPILIVGACATMRMQVPVALAPAPEWRVERHGGGTRGIRFGPYAARVLEDRDRMRGGILDALSGKHENQQRFELILRDTAAAKDLWQVRCDHRDVERQLGIRGVQIQLADRTSLECTLNPPGDPSAPWTLRLDRSGDRLPTGGLGQSADSTAYRIRGETRDGDGCCSVAGYLVRGGERALMSVDRADRGWVRIAPEAGEDERGLLAAVAAALSIANDMSADRGR